MLTWQKFLENINPKICIIMRGLPGSGKSSVIHKLLNQYGITYEGHVFSTDNQWIPETIARRKAGENIGDDFEHAEYQKNYDSAKSGGAHLKNLNLFKKAGINWLALGVEAANQNIRFEISKGSFQNVNIRQIVKDISAYDINIISNYIFGFPNDTIETMTQNIPLMVRYIHEYICLRCCYGL